MAKLTRRTLHKKPTAEEYKIDLQNIPDTGSSDPEGQKPKKTGIGKKLMMIIISVIVFAAARYAGKTLVEKRSTKGPEESSPVSSVSGPADSGSGTVSSEPGTVSSGSETASSESYTASSGSYTASSGSGSDPVVPASFKEAFSSSQYRPLDEMVYGALYAPAFRKEDESLAALVSGAVRALVQNGTYDKIAEKYPDIQACLTLNKETMDFSNIPEEGSGDPGYTFRQGLDSEYPPFTYINDDGTAGGFDVELCQAVCDYLGWEYEAVALNWDSIDQDLNSGACDCIWSAFMVTEERRSNYSFGIDYLQDRVVFLVWQDSDIVTLSDLAGKAVGVVSGSTEEYTLEDTDLFKTFSSLEQYGDLVSAANAVRAGVVDAIALNPSTALILAE